MSDCCPVPESEPAAAFSCPICGTTGKPVERQTVKALLTERALRRLGTSQHRFCPATDCDVVYFEADGNGYTKADVRVPVWQKEPFGARMVCYCFGENEAGIRAEMERLGRSEAVERVRGYISAGRCACEVRNPRGVCCLGDVTAAVKRVARSLQNQPEDRPASADGSARSGRSPRGSVRAGERG